MDQSRWRAEEILYVSETCTEDHYKLSHPKNEGTSVYQYCEVFHADVYVGKVTELGKIEFDLSHLKGRIPLSRPVKGQWHHSVTVLIDIVVIDRDLKFFVRWPANKDGEIVQGSQESFSMVAAFHPGTA
jgi:hypothetical protein